ncbi:hypothetical protein V8E52_005849 [Russula decolorans]|jgi:hypothetical protein
MSDYGEALLSYPLARAKGRLVSVGTDLAGSTRSWYTPPVDSAMGSNATFRRERKNWDFFKSPFPYPAVSVQGHLQDVQPAPPSPSPYRTMKMSNVNASALVYKSQQDVQPPQPHCHHDTTVKVSNVRTRARACTTMTSSAHCQARARSAAPTLSWDDEESSNPNPVERPYGVKSRSKRLYDAYLRMGLWACTLDDRSRVTFHSQT